MSRVSLLLLLLFGLVLSSWAQDKAPAMGQSDDPRLEVLTIVHLLSQNTCDTRLENYYRNDIQPRYGKYRSHTAVKYWKVIQDKYDLYPYEVSVNLTIRHGLFKVQQRDKNGFMSKLSERERAEFVRLLNDFSYKSGLMSYTNRSMAYFPE
ncbi:hypothetical protein [Pontibacter roseus]|uniref:hypothetical protein n=1 Tax=Pontibacter roseus TaxID=336989 RepID=UPI00035E3871|nr:hypothetical protein [Pontibacter roseus]